MWVGLSVKQMKFGGKGGKGLSAFRTDSGGPTKGKQPKKGKGSMQGEKEVHELKSKC